jgi:hypothetical protein
MCGDVDGLRGGTMSTTDPARTRATVQQSSGEGSPVDYGYGREDSGAGWVAFAGVMLMILATLNVIDGIAAVSDSTFFTENAKFVISNLNTYGWVLIICGVVQGLVALGVWARVGGIRWLGVGIASVNAVLQLLFIPAYPFWSLALFTLDVLVIYGLIAHGKRAGV